MRTIFAGARDGVLAGFLAGVMVVGAVAPPAFAANTRELAEAVAACRAATLNELGPAGEGAAFDFKRSARKSGELHIRLDVRLKDGERRTAQCRVGTDPVTVAAVTVAQG